MAQEAGADAISLINTFLAMAIDPETRKPRIANVTAGLSGPAIKPIALRMVYDAAHAVKIPIIGMGGISQASDIIEFLLAGATAVQVGTAMLTGDRCATEKIVDALRMYCEDHGIERISELTGGLLTDAEEPGSATHHFALARLSARPLPENCPHRYIRRKLVARIDQEEFERTCPNIWSVN